MSKMLMVLWFLSFGLLGALPARADVPAGVTTIFTGLATDFGTVVALGWTLFLVIVGGLALFGIVRAVVRKTAH
jgi:hypothetical protein